ncbi:hypothetical protein LVJ94_24785 [Pendulispora rubella]|uniref:Uncharacterized protein n=1 Tax=Pendulispora rubella TaxID=2741070 RepID=A0ABZ2LHM6_9BACT
MSAFPGSPRLLKGGLVLVDPDNGTVQKTIVLQYNPDTLTRSLQVQGVGENADRSEALRLRAPPVETIKLEAEIDAADQLEVDDNLVKLYGIAPILSALETTIYPTVTQIKSNHADAEKGTLEIAPMETALMLFVWSRQRTVPVRITELSVTEEAFDPALNPLRAKVNLGLRVLTVYDLGFTTSGNIYLAYQQNKEDLAIKATAGASPSSLGFTRTPQ